jgi:hypothetical protein
VAKVGTSKVGGTISQQAAVHPWLAADAHVQQQQQQQQQQHRILILIVRILMLSIRYYRETKEMCK